MIKITGKCMVFGTAVLINLLSFPLIGYLSNDFLTLEPGTKVDKIFRDMGYSLSVGLYDRNDSGFITLKWQY